jgi:hypothetical protein
VLEVWLVIVALPRKARRSPCLTRRGLTADIACFFDPGNRTGQLASTTTRSLFRPRTDGGPFRGPMDQ